MKADRFIKLVLSMINEEDYNNEEVQPLKQKLDRYRDLGKAFEDGIEILKVLEGE